MSTGPLYSDLSRWSADSPHEGVLPHFAWTLTASSNIVLRCFQGALLNVTGTSDVANCKFLWGTNSKSQNYMASIKVKP